MTTNRHSMFTRSLTNWIKRLCLYTFSPGVAPKKTYSICIQHDIATDRTRDSLHSHKPTNQATYPLLIVFSMFPNFVENYDLDYKMKRCPKYFRKWWYKCKGPLLKNEIPALIISNLWILIKPNIFYWWYGIYSHKSHCRACRKA